MRRVAFMLLSVGAALGCRGAARSEATAPDAGTGNVEETAPDAGESDHEPVAMTLDPNAAALCGGRGEPCCTGTMIPCGVQLACDAATATCVLPSSAAEGSQLCSREEDCAAGQLCCFGGLLGTCQPLAAGEDCALPDLAVYSYAPPFVGEMSPPGTAYGEGYGFVANYQCTQEKQCLGGPGPRRVLRVSLLVANVGQADLILGRPGATPGVKRAACDGAPYVENYVRFELLDSSRAVVVRGEGLMPASCAFGTAGPTVFDCGFLGLRRGMSELYDSGWSDCQWIDITDTPAGEYTLRVRVNPDRVLHEASYTNNTVEMPVSLPTFDPLGPCSPADEVIRSGFADDVWCEWQLPSARRGLGCNPGDLVQLSCPDCGGDPMLRICEGTEACSASEAWAFGIGDFFAENTCPTSQFFCPPSGVYSVLAHAGFSSTSATCDLAPQAGSDAGTPL